MCNRAGPEKIGAERARDERNQRVEHTRNRSPRSGEVAGQVDQCVGIANGDGHHIRRVQTDRQRKLASPTVLDQNGVSSPWLH